MAKKTMPATETSQINGAGNFISGTGAAGTEQNFSALERFFFAIIFREPLYWRGEQQ